mgnify:CR=1 FL=1
MNKKKWIILMMLLIVLSFSACASKETAPFPDDYVIDWIDPNLEKAMRAETEIYDRDILYGDVKGITSLYLSEKNISDISMLYGLPFNLSKQSLYRNGNVCKYKERKCKYRKHYGTCTVLIEKSNE